MVLASLSLTRVFYDIETEGLSKYKTLPQSDEFDVATTCTLADIDFDGQNEVLIGTFGEQFMVFKEDQETRKWSMIFIRSLNDPIHKIYHIDLTGDGIKDVFLVTLKSVIILQHDYDKVAELLEKRLKLLH